MANQWLYTTNAKPVFYQQRQYLYSAGFNSCDFHEKEGWSLSSMVGHKLIYYVRDRWLSTPHGRLAFNYGGT
jgi:hypothetical protein